MLIKAENGRAYNFDGEYVIEVVEEQKGSETVFIVQARYFGMHAEKNSTTFGGVSGTEIKREQTRQAANDLLDRIVAASGGLDAAPPPISLDADWSR